LYATSIVAPIIYIALYDPPGSKEFPSKLEHIFFVVIILIVSSTAFGLLRSGRDLNEPFMNRASILLFIFSFFLLFVSLIFKNRRLPKEPADFKSSEKDLSKQLQLRR
jgi:hypothetical protein